VLGSDDGSEGDSTGSLVVDGRDPRAARGVAGLVLQDPDSQVIMARVGDDVAFGCENLGVPRDELWMRVREALELVGLGVPLEHPTDALSGGQKQRLALALAFAGNPRLLLLDEPTTGLDPQMRREVQDHIAAIRGEGRAVLLATHDMAEAERLCDRIAVIAEGRVLATGAPRDLIAASGAATLEDMILKQTARA